MTEKKKEKTKKKKEKTKKKKEKTKKKKEKTKKKKEKVDKDKALNDVCAKVRMIIAVLEKLFGIDINADGKLGHSKTQFVVIMAIIAVMTMVVFAATTIIDNKPGPEGANYTYSDVSGVGQVTISGGEGDDAEIVLDADQGDDNADTWTIESEATGNDLSIINHTTEVLNLTSAGNLQVDGTFTSSGASTVDGLTVNGQVDINMTKTAEEIAISQTNATGVASTPMMKIDDARTGANANSAGEASIVINSQGSYGLAVSNGIVNIEGEIDSIGDITLDPAGNDVIADGTVDATAYTADAAAGLDTKTAGTLVVGASTATKVEIADASVETEVQGQLDVHENITVDSNGGQAGSYFIVDGAGTGANTNFFFTLGTSGGVSDDGGGSIIETNTSTAAEFGLRVQINGAVYFLLMEKE